ncbi:nucleotide pyrophosphohydrolase [Kurthia sibirica]|uniref:Nucleotide pyrophosphohydrolase n=1 Tax=Kurthia sibirica TaxID=202750 RepID=A0A2U3AK80_9BACL|nr:nucleotide pyrophosphohydrolase [Kurthia sibirica]PWI24937.1 nucleotide pyrophosphohydrolase [Kurthia sibirica]GEK33152.1 nucleotide pyrophosphohydrolase [Kurthia sibirica]
MQKIINEVVDFRKQRDWHLEQDPRSLAISVSLEASELLECFQWTSGAQAVDKYPQEIKEEMADVLIYLIALADTMAIDLSKAVSEKLVKNTVKYPVPQK